ncbi:hypothetical protein GCM10028822_29950 [Hymenobacter terrigena]
MTKSVLFSSLIALCLLGACQSASAQGAITNGGTYKMTHYGVPADASAAAYGVPAGTPLCLDVNLGLTTAGASIGQWGDNGIDGQRYIFELQTDGSYKLRHRGTVMYVQTVGQSKAANARIEQNVLLTSNDDAQRWFITDPNNNGRYKFTLKNSANAAGISQVLEVGFGSAAPGAPVNLFDDNAFEQAQRWQLLRTALATKNAVDSGLWLQAYPNPLAAGQALNLRVEAQRSGPAAVEVLDVMGRVVYRQTTSLEPGGNPMALANAPLMPGLYLVRLHQGGFVQQTQFVQQ